MALKELTHAQVAALVGEADALLPHAKWPDDGTGRDPRRQVYTFYRALMDAAIGRPDVADANYAPAITLEDDFLAFNDGDMWSYHSGTGGTPPTIDSDVVGGVVQFTPDSDASDDGVMHTTNRVIRFDTSDEWYFETRFKVAATSDSDADTLLVGLASGFGSDLVKQATAPATFDGAVFYKLEASSNWDFTAHNGATASADSDIVAFADKTWVRFGIHNRPGYDSAGVISTTKTQVTPYVNGVAGTACELTLSGLDLGLYIVFLAKVVGGGGAPVVSVDYVKLVCER